jgi:hypothetical protein
MTSIRKTFLAGLCALASFGTVSTAQAGLLPALGDTVNVTAEVETTGDTATISFAGLPGGVGSLSVYTAPVSLSGVFGMTSTVFTGLVAYCTDLYHYSMTPALYTVGSLTSSNQPNNTPALTSLQVNNITALINNTSHTDQAATQLAIWSVEYGTAFGFSDASGSTGSDATTYLAALTGAAPEGVTLYQLQSPTAQGFAFVQPVPEPMSIALLGLGMIATGAVVRRRQSTMTSTAC